MGTRSRAALLVASVAAGLALPAAGPAHAAECVKVVVDYGTVAGAPAGPNTRCVDVGEGGTAAEALSGRARYKGNFLCAIDDWPREGCGDEPPSPYWSFWVWRNGAWAYSSEGVATFTVSDADKDGHPDPLGFRYHEVDKKAPPRANPSYPRPATAPPRTTAPSRTAPPATGQPGATGGPRTGGTTGPGAGAATATAAASGTPAATGTPSAGAPGSTGGTAPGPSGSAGPAGAGGSPGPDGSTAPDVAIGEIPARPDQDGFPVGTVAGGFVAVGLLGAAAYRFRRPA